MRDLVCAFLLVYILVLFARAILSWFPPQQGLIATVNRVLFDVTEPVLAPLRRLIPPAGGLDLSFLVLTFALLIVRQAVCPG